MSFGVILKVALKALNRNKIRSVLTMLGIIIGVGAVIAMVALGQGARKQVQEEIAAIGTNTLWIRAGSGRSWGIQSGAGTVNTLTVDDLDAIAQECPTVLAISPSASAIAQVVFGNRNWNTRVEGYNEQYPLLRNWPLTLGNFFDESHVKRASRVAIVGQTVVDQLFDGGDPVGETIRVQNLPFRILGVLKAKGANAWGRDQDDTIIVPYTTVQKKFQGGVQYIQSGLVGAISARASYVAQEQIRELLRQRHRLSFGDDDDFFIGNLSEFADAAAATNRVMTGLLASIAAVSLLIGGIGIMNIMLVAVSERTREIGIRMAIGARPSHVRIQFLSEAIVLCMCGGLIGAALGLGGSMGITRFLGWPTVVSYNSVGISLFFAAGIGIFFGYYPAHKAAALDPIEALRYE